MESAPRPRLSPEDIPDPLVNNETPQQPRVPANPEQPTQPLQPEHSAQPEANADQTERQISPEKLAEIKQALGHTALIATEMSEEDQRNVYTEAVNLKTKEAIQNHPIINRVPIVGGVIKAAIAARYRRTAKDAVRRTNDYSSAFEALGLDAAASHSLNSETDSVQERARHSLERAGYSSDNQVEYAGSRLDENEKVEKMNDATTNAVKQALNQYYSSLRAGGDRAELSRDFDHSIEKAFAGKENLGVSIDLQKQKEGIERLAENQAIEEEAVKDYVDSHISLYKASMKEGIYTKQKVDSIVSAVVAGGVAGGVLAALSSREGLKALRSAANVAVAATGAGAIVGAVGGVARGINRAKVKLSEAEIKAATSFDTPANEAETSTETEDAATVETADEETQSAEDSREAAASVAERNHKKANIFARLDGFRRKLTGEDKYTQQIEELRDRKEASELIDNFDQLMANLDPADADTEKALLEAYVDVVARGKFSSDKKLDLIKYQDNRGALEDKLSEVEKALYGDDPQTINDLLSDPNSDLSQALQNRANQLNQDFLDANKLRTKFIVRSAMVDAVTGALAGGIAGGVFGAIHDSMPSESGALSALAAEDDVTTPEETVPSNLELVEDPDGGFMVKLGEENIIGEGDAKGIEFDDDGSLTDQSKEMFEAAGIHVQEKVTPHEFENATKNVSLNEFFDPKNKEANGLTEVTSRNWISDNGRDMVVAGNTHMDGEGNIIMEVAPTQGYDVDMEGMKVLLTPGNGNASTGIALDINPDGTVVIPSDSPAASLFDGESYQGGYAEIIREGEDGHIDVYQTLGDGQPDVDTITVENPGATYNEYEYTLTVDGEKYDIAVPEEISKAARLEALNGFESVKSAGDPVGYEATGTSTTLTTNTGEAVQVEHFEHHGGYSDVVDSYFGEKDGVYNSGESIVRKMVGAEGAGLSSQEVDRIFLDKVSSGEIAEGDVIEEYLKTIGNSPEALTTTRAMMGDFEFDIDGDGVSEVIDTQDEINMVSDIISRDPEAYDVFVNDTYEMFYDKIDGGSLRFIDYTQEQYQYTTWGVLGEDNNILQRLGAKSSTQTDGVGLVFTDKNGNSIYDESTVRSLWRLPDDYKLEYVADRLNCDQKTGRGFFSEKADNEKTDNEKTDNEKTDNEKTDNEKTDNEKTDNEKTDNEKTDNEKTDNEKTDNEKTDNEKTDNEKTDNEKTDNEKTDNEKTDNEKTDNEKTDNEKTDNEKTDNEKTDNEKTDNEKTDNEKTDNEKTDNEKTDNEKTDNEKTDNEKTDNEKTDNEKTDNEKTDNEKTEDEGTDIEQKDAENLARIDNDIDTSIENDVGTEEINHDPNPGVSEDDITEEPQESDYQGTEAEIVEHEAPEEEPATPVQEDVSSDNDYSESDGGAHEEEYNPVQEEQDAQSEADNRGDSAADEPDEVEEALEDLDIK